VSIRIRPRRADLPVVFRAAFLQFCFRRYGIGANHFPKHFIFIKTENWSPVEDEANKTEEEYNVNALLSLEATLFLDTRLSLRVEEVLSGEDKLGMAPLLHYCGTGAWWWIRQICRLPARRQLILKPKGGLGYEKTFALAFYARFAFFCHDHFHREF
jgi:hypothetical protein